MVLSAIKRGGDRLERLVNDFMVIQQIEGGIAERTAKSRRRSIPISELTSSILDGLNGFSDTDRARIVTDSLTIEDKRNVKVFIPHIVEAILRLVSNGIKFGLSQPVYLSARVEEEFLVLCVRDFGNGFNLERLPQALSLFGQLDREQYEQQGGGFGLTIAERLITFNDALLKFCHCEEISDSDAPSNHAFDAQILIPLCYNS
jgi:signal transduction histidine kinase